MKICPTCRLVSPDTAKVCDCGYDFETGVKSEKPQVGRADAKTKNHPLWKVLGWVGAFLGWVIGRSAPVQFLMALGGLGLAALLSRRLKPSAKPMRPSLIAQGGVLFATAAGGLLGLIIGQPLPTAAVLEVVVSTAGLIWLATSPSILPVVLLTLYQLIAITGNLYTTFGTPNITAAAQAIGLMAVFLRGAGIALMLTGLREIRRQAIVVSSQGMPEGVASRPQTSG